MKAVSVEGIWQGLKVFEKEDISFSTFENDTMKNIKGVLENMENLWGIGKVLIVRKY